MKKPLDPPGQPRWRKSPAMSLSDAEGFAIDALRFFGADPDRLWRFLALSGLEGIDLRRAAAMPGFFLGVMDQLMADEPLLMAFCAAQAVDPARLVDAHRLLRQQAGDVDLA